MLFLYHSSAAFISPREGLLRERCPFLPRKQGNEQVGLFAGAALYPLMSGIDNSP